MLFQLFNVSLKALFNADETFVSGELKLTWEENGRQFCDYLPFANQVEYKAQVAEGLKACARALTEGSPY